MKKPFSLRALGALSRVAPELAGRAAAHLFVRPRRHSPRPWELEAARGAREQRLVDGSRLLHFGERGPRVLAVHGWEGRATQLAPLAARLVAEGLRVAVLDGPAHGASPGRVAHPVAFARALAAAARQLGDVEALVGHSMGGGAVLLAVREEGVPARAVTLVAAPSSFAGVLSRFSRFAGLSRGARDAFFAAMTRTVDRRAEELDLTSGGISAPALIFHDPEDREVPFSDARDLVAGLPDARLVVQAGAGHRVILRRPEVLEETARFLGGLLIGGAREVPARRAA
jgi:pimeloyl-ACP methyl ester carboxylesterase